MAHLFKQGWFSELSPDDAMWPGQAMSVEVSHSTLSCVQVGTPRPRLSLTSALSLPDLQITATLHDERSEFQHIQVFETKSFGRMLALDGVIQLTEKDECSYQVSSAPHSSRLFGSALLSHGLPADGLFVRPSSAQEMIANLPLCAHPRPQRVAIIGGGDGGVVREILRHPSVETVDHCEIDRRVCEVAMEYLPSIASELQRSEVTTHYKDGAQFLKDHPDSYDVIIVDSSDPVGPAASLFETSFYKISRDALRDGGVLCTQAECLWNNLSLIGELYAACAPLFQQCAYAYTTVPTYPSGQIGFMVCRKGAEPVAAAVRAHPAADKLRYYTEEMHKAAFVLPKFAVDAMRPRL